MSDKLPDGWRWVKLGDVCEMGSGGTPNRGTAAYFGGDIPWVIIGDLNDGIVTHTRQTITDLGLANSSAKLVPAGAILVAMYGSIGKLGIAGAELTTNQAIAHLVPHTVLDPYYLFQYLRADRERLATAGAGMAQSNISQTVLKGWDVPLPPLDEQRRIVARLEGHLATAERARSAALAQLAAIEAMPAALLRQIFPRSPARELLTGWRWAKLGDMCEIVNGSTPKSAVPEYWGGDICWVTPTDLGQLDTHSIERTERSITIAGYNSCSTTLVPAGAVVMSSRAPIGHLAIAATELCTNQGCKAFVPTSAVESKYLYYTLRNSMDDIRALGVGATFAEVSKRTLAAFTIPLPPIDEQRRIVRELDEQTAAIERARAAAQARLDAIEALPTAALRLAFTP